jgi:hypothetical protein
MAKRNVSSVSESTEAKAKPQTTDAVTSVDSAEAEAAKAKQAEADKVLNDSIRLASSIGADVLLNASDDQRAALVAIRPVFAEAYASAIKGLSMPTRPKKADDDKTRAKYAKAIGKRHRRGSADAVDSITESSLSAAINEGCESAIATLNAASESYRVFHLTGSAADRAVMADLMDDLPKPDRTGLTIIRTKCDRMTRSPMPVKIAAANAAIDYFGDAANRQAVIDETLTILDIIRQLSQGSIDLGDGDRSVHVLDFLTGKTESRSDAIVRIGSKLGVYRR